ncbi:MAG: SRPBCC family protein [Pirellulales bacterium]|nr:SRPBCC family protein [Pirellulales bacterium]
MAASLQLSGEELFRAPPERLFAVMTDMDLLAANIPDLASSERVGERQLKCTVRPGFGFLRGTLKLDIGLESLDPPRGAVMRIAGRGIGTEIDVASTLAIAPHDGGSRLAWSADVTRLKGLIATVSPTLIQAAAGQVLKNGWQQIRRQLGE